MTDQPPLSLCQHREPVVRPAGVKLFKVVTAEQDADATGNEAFSNPPPRTSPEKPIEARTSTSEVPGHRQRGEGTPRSPEAAVEGRQVGFDDEAPD